MDCGRNSLLHVGHFILVLLEESVFISAPSDVLPICCWLQHLIIQSQQYIWPHGVQLGFFKASMHREHFLLLLLSLSIVILLLSILLLLDIVVILIGSFSIVSLLLSFVSSVMNILIDA